MKKNYLPPTTSVQDLMLGNNILSFSGVGNAPSFEDYTTDGEIPWN